ncbi:MAG TPA: hemolysin family protein [Vicinamibacteria bacterium]
MKQLLLLGAALLLVLLNGFFVAAEFAIVKVRATKVRELAEQGDWRATMAKNVIEHLDAYLSACQLGITIASLGLGWIGEPAVARLIEPGLRAAGVVNQTVIHTIAFSVAFVIISFLHIVLGELAPKSLAIRKPESLSLWLSPPLRAFYWLMYIPIAALNGAANWILRILGIEPVSESGEAHSSEELRMIVAASHTHGALNATERRLLENVIDFSERQVAEIMTPRVDMVCLFVNRSLAENLQIVRGEQHTRYPLADGSADNVIGMIHIKDFMTLIADKTSERGGSVLQSIKRPVLFVPESATIDAVLRTMQATRTLMAIVVDEYGGVAGLVTLEDVLEELVGEIRDEFDEMELEVERRGGETIVDGGLPLNEVEEMFPDLVKEEDTDVRTVGGIVLKELGRIPVARDAVNVGPYRLEVIEMDNLRITRVKIERVSRPVGTPEDEVRRRAESSGGSGDLRPPSS